MTSHCFPEAVTLAPVLVIHVRVEACALRLMPPLIDACVSQVEPELTANT